LLDEVYARAAAKTKNSRGPSRNSLATPIACGNLAPMGGDMATQTVTAPGRAMMQVRGLRRSFYGVQALNGVSFDVAEGSITALIGPNGAGKTTAFNCISGVIPPEGGTVTVLGADITGLTPDRIHGHGVVRTFQIARGFPTLTVLETLLLHGEAQPGERC
jgi:ABC-type branched-subunit amino acid transport system ATPase component